MHSGADHGRSPILKSPERPLKLRTAFQWSESRNESESDAVTDWHGVPRRRLHRYSIKTVVKCVEDGDFYSHERPVCVPEACDVRIELIPLDGSATAIVKEIGGVCCLRNSS